MKFTIKCKEMSVSLTCGSLRDLRITVHRGRPYTNPLADEIDKYPWYTVLGTAFSQGHSSIHFSSKGCRRQDVANTIAHCMEKVFGDLDMDIEIKRVSAGRG